jgi:hypothetical protein
MSSVNWKSNIGIQILHTIITMKEKNVKYPKIAEEVKKIHGVTLSADTLRKAYNKHKDTYLAAMNVKEEVVAIYDQLEAEETEGIPAEVAINPDEEDKQRIKEAKEKAQKERDERLLKKLLKERGTTELVVETFRETIKAYERLEITPPAPVNVLADTEEALLLFSDAQIGEEIKKEDTNGFGEYNIGIFRERMQLLTRKVRERTHMQSLSHKITTLNIFMLGDNVDGIGIYRGQEHHLDALVVEQFLIGAEEIARALIELLGTFQQIKIWGIVGNHGRMGRKGENPSHVNFDYLLYKMLEKLLVNYSDRIEWVIPKSNWTLATVNGQGFLLLHGDTIKGWNSIPYYGIDRADSRFTKMLAGSGRDYRYMCLGHHHNPGDVDSPNGEKILNGTMVGGSDFSINTLHTSSRPSQWFFGIHKDKGITWRDKILLDQE